MTEKNFEVGDYVQHKSLKEVCGVIVYKNNTEICIERENGYLWTCGPKLIEPMPAPKRRKVKFLGWLSPSNGLHLLQEGEMETNNVWKRVPSADVEYEVEE